MSCRGRACPGQPDRVALPCQIIEVAGTSPATTRLEVCGKRIVFYSLEDSRILSQSLRSTRATVTECRRRVSPAAQPLPHGAAVADGSGLVFAVRCQPGLEAVDS